MYKPEEMFNFEDTYAHGKRLHFIQKSIEEYCHKEEKSKEQIKILDIGCGTGVGVTLPIASLGYKIIGVDIDRTSIDWARDNNIYPNASFESGNLKNLTHLSNFDIIICSEVLEHVLNPKEFILLLKSRLRSNGIIIFTVPNGYSWFELEKFLYWKMGFKYPIKILTKLRLIPVRREFLPLITLKKDDKHVQFFTHKKLTSLFQKTNLRIVSSAKSTVFGGPISESLFWWCKPLLKFNIFLGKIVFPYLVIGWYFVVIPIQSTD